MQDEQKEMKEMRISSTASELINFMQILSQQEVSWIEQQKEAFVDFMKICLSLKCHEKVS